MEMRPKKGYMFASAFCCFQKYRSEGTSVFVRQTYNVTLNGQRVIVNFEGNRSPRGFIGLQNHLPKDVVFFRNIVVTPV